MAAVRTIKSLYNRESREAAKQLGLMFVFDGRTMILILAVTLFFSGAFSAGLDCDFENDMCNWQNVYNDFSWKLKSGPTATPGTGPQGDHTTGSGQYIYLRATDTYDGNYAELESPQITGSKCLNFWYHMYGTGVGTLRVYLDYYTKIFEKSGSQGNVWQFGQVPFSASGSSSRLYFYGERGSSDEGDIALDDVYLTDTCAPSPQPTVPPSGSGCGNRPSTRIVGGTTATPGDWPWQAMLTDTNWGQFCGGSLIDPQWVLTAAHCLENENENTVRVRLGAHKRTTVESQEQTFNVLKIIRHGSYNSPKQMSNDIALLKLDKPATLNSYTNLVCLPSVAAPVGASCWITGWGTLAAGGSQPEQLQQASVPVVSHAKCTSAYGSSSVDGSMLCAGFDQGAVDSCQGDSGGPLVCESGGKYYLHGATSWGHGCASAGKYGVYARVQYLLSWVQTKMSQN